MLGGESEHVPGDEKREGEGQEQAGLALGPEQGQGQAGEREEEVDREPPHAQGEGPAPAVGRRVEALLAHLPVAPQGDRVRSGGPSREEAEHVLLTLHPGRGAPPGLGAAEREDLVAGLEGDRGAVGSHLPHRHREAALGREEPRIPRGLVEAQVAPHAEEGVRDTERDHQSDERPRHNAFGGRDILDRGRSPQASYPRPRSGLSPRGQGGTMRRRDFVQGTVAAGATSCARRRRRRRGTGGGRRAAGRRRDAPAPPGPEARRARQAGGGQQPAPHRDRDHAPGHAGGWQRGGRGQSRAASSRPPSSRR